MLGSDQAHPALKRDVGPGPFEHDGDAVAETDEPEDVQEDPEQPREIARDSQAEDVAHRRSASDRRHDAVVAIVKGFERLLSDGTHDVPGCVRTLLHRDLRDARQRFSVLRERTNVTGDEDRWVTGNGQCRLRGDAARAIERHADRACQRRSGDAGCP